MEYCKNCILPSTHPFVNITPSGVCTACRQFEKREQIDWSHRRKTFERLVSNVKENSSGYDCVIPVSGGKDSHWQVVQCLEYDLNPLTVSWIPPDQTDLGRRNLQNLVDLGVDHVGYRINPEVEKKFMKKAFLERGASAIPKHMAVFSIPLKVALEKGIPLVVWGENSAVEYGDEDQQRKGVELDDRWLEKFGSVHGTSPDDWVGDQLSRKDLTPYYGPSSDALEKAGIRAVFLGHYFPWDPMEAFEVAREHGFEARREGSRTGYYEAADADSALIAVHHFLKWHKFGYDRLFDDLSLEIRNGRLTREEAVNRVKEEGPILPEEEIQAFCNFVEISRDQFFKVAEQFRNPNIWIQQNDNWKINNFLIKDWPHWQPLNNLFETPG